jgi:AcrR family transcriptional regulator
LRLSVRHLSEATASLATTLLTESVNYETVLRIMRVRSESWFSDLLRAATKVFAAKGYRQTQMSDIAREMGVSQGTLYTYVESKETLFLLVCQGAFSDSQMAAPQQPPIASLSFDAMLQKVREQRFSTTRLETLRTALRTKNVVDPIAELEGVLRELYSVIERNRRGFDLIERSALDVPEMAQMLYVEGRRKAVGIFARYLTNRIESGYFTPVPDPATAARFIIEAVTWFARHRHTTPDSQMISDNDALETTIHFLTRALIPSARDGPKPPRKRTRAIRGTPSGASAPQFAPRQ